MRRLFGALARLWTALFGVLHWTPPLWLAAMARWVRQLLTPVGMAWAWLREPRRWRITGATLVVLGLVAGVYELWPRPPEPARLSVSVDDPPPTPLRKDATPESLAITFGGSAAPIARVDRPVTEGVRLSPALEGQWRWEGDNRLLFTPSADWPVDEQFHVTFEPGLVADHVLLEDNSVRFHTARFAATLESADFYQDPVDPKIKKIVATLTFTHPVDPKSLEKRVGMRLLEADDEDKSTPLDVTISYDELRAEAYVHSAVIAIPARETHAVITIDDGVASSRGGHGIDAELTREIYVPGVYNLFHIEDTAITLVRNARYEPEQVLVVTTTTGVHEDELQKNLRVLLLPKDKPEGPEGAAVEDFTGWDIDNVSRAVLDAATPVALSAIPAELTYPTQHTFKIQAPVGRQLFVRVQKGTRAYGDYLLAEAYTHVVSVPEYPRELEIMHNGAILALTGERRLSVMARGLAAMRVELWRVLPAELNHLVSQTGGRFDQPQFQSYRFDEENISEVFREVRTLDGSDPVKTQYAAVDFAPHLTAAGAQGNRGLFFLHVQGWDPQEKQVLDVEDRRFLLVTDLGVLVKDDAVGGHEIFVVSFATGKPVVGATVEVLGKNGLAIVSRHTDDEGHASVPPLGDFRREKEPMAYVVRAGADVSFLPIGREDRQLDLSRFDVGGVTTGDRASSLDAYLFSERGIYRPGDTFHVGAIVKPVSWQGAVAGVPIQLAVTDPRGLEVHKEQVTLPASGFVELAYTTEESSPTGGYTVQAYIIKDKRRDALLGSTTVRVEEFLPDRLRIRAQILPLREQGWVKPEGLRAHVELYNLFGTPAAGHNVTASVRLWPADPSFVRYAEYHFFDPRRAQRSYEEELDSTTTDEQGVAELPVDLSRFDAATYRLTLLATGYELDGGRGVSAAASVLVSPRDFLIGLKADGDLSYVKRDEARSVEVIAVAPDLEKMATEGLRTQIVERRWVSVLVRQDDGTYAYQSVLKELPKKSAALALPKAGKRIALETSTPGDYALVIQDAAGLELNRVLYTVVGDANVTRSLERNAELQLRLDRKDYAPGDTIEVSIKAPYTGVGLLTIERDRVYAHAWFRTTTTSSVQSITLPAGIDANAYVSVAFTRAIDSPEIFMSPLSYAVVPFTVSRAQRTVQVTLEAPGLVRPGDEVVLTYATDMPATLALFAVDEGILQVAGYTTPDPLSYFLQKRALEVGTSQILDLLLPEYSLMRRISQAGGDEGADALAKNLNPFKRKRDAPVVYWSGLVDASAQARTVRYRVPDYFNGTLRVMAVAVAPEAIGVAERRTLVRGPFVINPNVPLFVGPGDTFEASVAVANNVEGSGKSAEVELSVTPSIGLELAGEGTQKLVIGEGQEQAARFTFKAKPTLGNAELTFVAKRGDARAKYTTTLSIRPPTPYLTTLTSGRVRKGSTDVAITRSLYPDLRRLDVAVSPLPLSFAHGLKAYLERYPYGCTEQLVSQTVPALVLQGYPSFGISTQTARKALSRTLAILRGRQNDEGAFGFWSAGSFVSSFQTVYAMHFLTEVAERRAAPVGELLSSGREYLRALGSGESSSLAEVRVRAYALYVLARNHELASDVVAELRGALDADKRLKWREDVTALYLAATYALMRDRPHALELLAAPAKAGKEAEHDDEVFYDRQVYLAQYLYLVAKHFPERLDAIEGPLVDALAKGIEEGQYNTISSAYTILALDAYAQALGDQGADALAGASVAEVRSDKDVRPLTLAMGGLAPSVAFAPETAKVRVTSTGDRPVYYQVTTAGFDTAAPPEVIKNGLEVIREYRGEGGGALTEVPLGDTIEVHLKVRSLGERELANVALVDLLPGGFDVVLEGGADASPVGRIATSASSWDATYADVREDRVIFFGFVGSSVREIVYKIRATTRGKFTVPPAYGEAMYERAVQARSTAAVITVSER